MNRWSNRSEMITYLQAKKSKNKFKIIIYNLNKVIYS